jgi:cellulose synthase operon protein YhjQ
MKVVTIVSAKGGVGKTTLAANLASVLATATARRVLAVDLDPQNALRLHFGVAPDIDDGLVNVALSGKPWSAAMVGGIDHIAVLPFGVVSEAEQRRFERLLDDEPAWFARGLAALSLADDDIVIVDTPPGSSAFTRAALTAATYAVNVVLPDAASYAAIPQMRRMIDAYAAPRPDFVGEGYVVNQIDQSRDLNRDVLRVLRERLGAQLFGGGVHADEGVTESLACQTTLIHYAPQSQASVDLNACGAWLLREIGARPSASRSVA